MSQFNILHFTDLHLDDVTSPNENLRKAKYKEFIDGLSEKIAEVIGEKIDTVVCTGDFINKGKVGNFEHAISIMNFLVKKFSLSNKDVAVCIGNHDIIVSDDKAGKSIDARKAFTDLEKLFQPDTIIEQNDIYKIFRCSKKDIYFLCFDSTFGSKGENLPSKLSDHQIDEIITQIDEKIPADKVLIVLSHYPMILFNRSQVVNEEDNWVDKHLWKSGNLIVERCYLKRKGSLTFWFFGDGHLPDFWSYNDYHHFLMTGMIGGNYLNPTYKDSAGVSISFNKTNEAKVIQIDTETKAIKIHTFSYKSKGINLSPHVGMWDSNVSDLRIVDNPFEKQIKPQEEIASQIGAEKKSFDTITTLVSQSVEDEIINQIRDKRLYSFNRYATSKKEVSLGWVSISKLFESKELLSRCIEKSVKWLDDLPGISISKENTIFIGIDFWGAIFASQASIIKDVENYCIATKSKGQHNVLLEKPEFLCNKLQEKKMKLVNIVLFTDVISTGNTVLSIQQKIRDCLEQKDNLNWIALSIISDVKQGRNIELNNITALGALCKNLRIPILNTEDLPDETILPIKYDIR